MYIEEIRRVVCTRCPRGCDIQVTVDPDNVAVEVVGARCKAGEEKAAKDAVLPERIVTAFVYAKDALEPVSAKTAEAVPREVVDAVLDAAKELEIKAPVKRGQVLCEDIAGTGVALIAAKEVEKKLSDENSVGSDLPEGLASVAPARIRRRFN